MSRGNKTTNCGPRFSCLKSKKEVRKGDKKTMGSLILVIITLAFFITAIAIVAIVFGQSEPTSIAIQALGKALGDALKMFPLIKQ